MQIAYNDMCMIVGDLFITRWLDTKEAARQLESTTQDFQRRIKELEKDREELLAKIVNAEASVTTDT